VAYNGAKKDGDEGTGIRRKVWSEEAQTNYKEGSSTTGRKGARTVASHRHQNIDNLDLGGNVGGKPSLTRAANILNAQTDRWGLDEANSDWKKAEWK